MARLANGTSLPRKRSHFSIFGLRSDGAGPVSTQDRVSTQKAGFYTKVARGSSGGVGLHPRLENQDCGHAIDGLTALLNGEIGLAQKAIGFGRSPALIP